MNSCSEPGTAVAGKLGEWVTSPGLSDPEEIRRLFALAGVPIGTVFSNDAYAKVYGAAPYSVATNTDFAGGAGDMLGGTLGLEACSATFAGIADKIQGCDVSPVIEEIEKQEERLVRACDKYLHRFDPPSVAIFAGSSYAEFAADSLKHYLDADIRCIGLRNDGPVRYPARPATGLDDVKKMIEESDPDLVFGSSFERSVSGTRGFVGLIPPLRGEVRLAPRPIAGINGTLSFMEDVLNTCMDRKNRLRKS